MKRCFYCMQEIVESQIKCPSCGRNPFDNKRESYHITPGTWLENRYLVGVSEEYRGDSIIYSGFDKILQQTVAIKEFFPLEYAVRGKDLISVDLYSKEFQMPYEDGLKAFIGEAKKLARFRNIDGITRIYDVFQDNNTAYQIMEAVSGRSLSDYIFEKGKLPVEETINLLEPVAISLIKIHSEGLIHRNISPDTIFIDGDGKAKLTDFGAARNASAIATKSLSVIIDPGFSPAEQYMSSGNQGAWTDVYALAATMYKCITGVTPKEAVSRSKEDLLRRPSQYGIEIDDEAEDALMHALCTDITERTLTISDFLDELHRDKSNVITKKINGWHVYAVVCLLLWTLSLTLSLHMLKKTSDHNLNKGIIHKEKRLLDSIDNKGIAINMITTEDKGSNLDKKEQGKSESDTTTEITTEITIENSPNEINTEKSVNNTTATNGNASKTAVKNKDTETKTEAKVSDNKKKSEKKSEPKKKTSEAASESNSDTSGDNNDTEEVIYIED